MSILDVLPKVKLERESEVRKKVAIGAAIGLTVGTVAGVLLAPKVGKKPQEAMQEVTEKITEETHKIMRSEDPKSSGANNEQHVDSHFKKITEITTDEVDAFKKNLNK